jgi:hypothetical protein
MMLFESEKIQFKGASAKGRRETDNCAVCIETFKESDQVLELNCAEGHIFHLDCLMGWFER